VQFIVCMLAWQLVRLPSSLRSAPAMSLLKHCPLVSNVHKEYFRLLYVSIKGVQFLKLLDGMLSNNASQAYSMPPPGFGLNKLNPLTCELCKEMLFGMLLRLV
jgi:hypothetical protein